MMKSKIAKFIAACILCITIISLLVYLAESLF